ncbi:DUF2989 domain-containing protein [Vibrio sp. SM6]|uniref:DUF2989 domain-containing protein n=1 Tax=Vibrio agarilyticus TaxID=2726741 RepID=A0A7X8TTH6_9VIBR|nr:DUF2989 domain-containing protein [Vibrio agarilyticus]NLS14524.1 DUF2989 domain-containing protein [Vibrio agarilyticus]
MKQTQWTALRLLPFFAIPLLSGCFKSNSTDALCNETPALRCELLNIDDGQCRKPRTDLIWHRYDVLNNPSDQNKIEEYRLVSEYRKCLELASQIAPIDQTELKQKRFAALMHSIEELDRIQSDLTQYKTPQALYFLWSQLGDRDAQRQFLQLEGKPELETAELQYALATFYTSRDHIKTLTLLNRALELSPKEQINTEILQTLSSTNQLLRNKERAYIWAMVAKSFNVPLADKQELHLLYGFESAKYDELDNIAKRVVKALNQGNFNAALVPEQFD